MLAKQRELILYIIFGMMTVAVNFASYYVLTKVVGMEYLAGNALAWVAAVVFAYITNRVYVFQSKIKAWQGILRQFTAFVSCRLFSGAIDMLIMYLMIDKWALNDLAVKVFANIIVVVINYVVSKCFIFKQ